MKISRPVLLAAAAVVVAALVAYSRTFTAPFIFDDEPSILLNPTITRLWPLWKPLSPPPDFGVTVSGRPLLNLTLALNYAISGPNVWSYHAFNVIVHALAGLVLFGVVRRTWLRPVVAGKFGDQSLPAAFAIALLWVLHPLQTESVTYTIQRAESLMGLCYLLTLYGFIRSVEGHPEANVSPGKRGTGWRVVAVMAGLAGAMCKEVMVTAPVVVLLYDRTFVSGSFRAAWLNRRGFHGALFLTWLPLAWLVAHTGNRGGTFVLTPAVCGQFWLTQFEAVTHYLRLAFWPAPLIFEYGIFKVERVAQILPQAALVAALLGATIWALFRRPIAGFLGAVFFLLLAPTSVVPGVTQVIVEHRMYLPLAAVITLVAGGATARFGRAAAGTFVAVALVAGVLTVRRNEIYRSDLTLWRDTVEKSPGSAKAQSNLGTALYRRGEYDGALPHYAEALRLDLFSPQNHHNLGLVLDKLGRFEESIPHYAEAVRLQPHYAQAHARLGAALVRQGKLPEAVEHLSIALRDTPDAADAQSTLGAALVASGRAEEAIGCYQAALRLRPDYAEAECGLGSAAYRLGRMAEAQQHLERALKLKPELADAHYNLGLVRAAGGRSEDALAHYAEAVRLLPTLGEARLNWGIGLAQSGRLTEALPQLQEAVRLKPASAEAQGNLGLVLAEDGRVEEAVPHYEEALRLRPDYSVMHYNLGNALLRLERWREARGHFSEAVRLAPDFAAAREMLERMQTRPGSP